MNILHFPSNEFPWKIAKYAKQTSSKQDVKISQILCQ